jgi:hypothetical protein
MNYIYLASQYCNKDTTIFDIYDDLPHGQLHYICYHVTTNSKYPFVQIMLDLKEEFTLPSVTIHEDISDSIYQKIKIDLKKLRCDIKEYEYKGVFRDINGKVYALVDVSSVNITCLHLLHSTKTWFALPTEIINIGTICDIPISKEVIQLFTYVMPELGVLLKNKLPKVPYLLPDIVYTGSDLKQSEFQTLFGPSKERIYYRFYNSFLKATKTKKSIEAVNRYALFIENPIILDLELEENENVEDLEDIEEFVYEKCNSTNCIIIQPHVLLVKEYELFQPLSYHTLDPLMSNSRYKVK